MPAEVYNRGGIEKIVILDTRQDVIQPFRAPNWTDLRIGWLLSVTDESDDDKVTALGETISAGPGGLIGPEDRYWIGVKTSDDNLPSHPRTVFIGYTNKHPSPAPRDPRGTTRLSSSDLAVGTTNAYFWRPNNSQHSYYSAMILDGRIPRAHSSNGVEIHFAQDLAHSGGYATLLLMRLQRVRPDSRVITVTMKQGSPYGGDVLFTDDPSEAVMRTNLEAFPTTVQTLGPVEVTAVPDAFYYYWPFTLSRLRIHCQGFMKAR